MKIQNPKFQLKILRQRRISLWLKNSGFSLIEMLVAMVVFATAATIATGALLAMSDAQQKILSQRIVQDNLSYVFDTMSKEIRTGSSYHCGSSVDDFSDTPRDCAEGGASFTFRNAASPNQKITYRLNNGRIERVYEGGTPSESHYVLTAQEINVANFKFYVQGALPNDDLQPRVAIVLQGIAGVKEKVKSKINIQTLISQRVLDS